MEQITVRVSEDTRRRLEARARASGLRLSDVVRLAIERDLGEAESKGDGPLLDRVRDLVGCLHSGIPDLAENHSGYLRKMIRENAR
jgi:hypothetical protein